MLKNLVTLPEKDSKKYCVKQINILGEMDIDTIQKMNLMDLKEEMKEMNLIEEASLTGFNISIYLTTSGAEMKKNE